MRFIAIGIGLVLASGLVFAKEVTAEIKVQGMTCGSCVVAVKKALTDTKGVKTAEVSLEKSLATVVYEDSQVTEKQLTEAINKSGFKAEPTKQSGK
jgi:copper chaperone CopZ